MTFLYFHIKIFINKKWMMGEWIDFSNLKGQKYSDMV